MAFFRMGAVPVAQALTAPVPDRDFRTGQHASDLRLPGRRRARPSALADKKSSEERVGARSQVVLVLDPDSARHRRSSGDRLEAYGIQ